MEPILTAQNVTFRYDAPGARSILDGLDFALPRGGITVLLGNSGCGKSTLALVLAGLLPQEGGTLTEGAVFFEGTALADLPSDERARRVAVLFQNCDLQFCMSTLREEVRFCLENLSVERERMEEICARAADLSGCVPLLDRGLHTLSGGEKQRAALCCALALGSPCLLLDEPFANVDPQGADSLISLLRRLCDERGLTVLAVDHRPERWMGAADRFALMARGRIVAADLSPAALGNARELFDAHGIAFPGDIPRRRARRAGGTAAVALRGVTVGVPGTARRSPASPEDALLRCADATFYRGRVTAILGRSGAGKTTLLRALAGQEPCGGTLELFGAPAARGRRAAKRVGIVFQNPANQFVSQRVAEEILFSLRVWNRGRDQAWCARRAEELLASFGLEQYQDWSPYMLSQGQQRRLAVLAMLAGGSGLLLLDEPTYGQDSRTTAAIMERLARRVDRDGLTVVLTTHDESLARAWADAVWILEDQKLREVDADEIG